LWFNQIKWKLLVTYLAVVAICIGVAIAIARELTISSYSEHIRLMAERGMGGMMSSMASDLNQSFRETLDVSLLWGGLAAAAMAILMSVFIARHITRPVHNMAVVTEKIAEGDYSQRVEVKTNDEIGSLAHSLNSMAGSLEESQRLRRELIANIAHELRTPLTSISGYMEGLADGVISPSAEIYELVHREAGRLRRLVDDLQRLARAESGRETLELVKLPIEPFIQRVVKKLKPQYFEKKVSLVLAVHPGTPALMVDEDKMDQILMNLLDNALRYTDPGGQVTVNVAGKEGKVAIQIKDTGIGISNEDLPHIFERFYRVDKSRSREKGGSGIGLTITKRYVESLHGNIEVKSKVGEGTTVTLLMPAAT